MEHFKHLRCRRSAPSCKTGPPPETLSPHSQHTFPAPAPEPPPAACCFLISSTHAPQSGFPSTAAYRPCIPLLHLLHWDVVRTRRGLALGVSTLTNQKQREHTLKHCGCHCVSSASKSPSEGLILPLHPAHTPTTTHCSCTPAGPVSPAFGGTCTKDWPAPMGLLHCWHTSGRAGDAIVQVQKATQSPRILLGTKTQHTRKAYGIAPSIHLAHLGDGGIPTQSRGKEGEGPGSSVGMNGMKWMMFYVG